MPGTQYTELYLDCASRQLRREPPHAASSITFDSTRPNTDGGRAVFTHKFETDAELSGYMKLKLWVSAEQSDDMDLFVGLRKLDRRGNEVAFPDFNHIEHGLLARGWLRVSHRELDPQRASRFQPWLKHQRALKLNPGEIVEVEIEIWPSSTLFRSGEALTLAIQGGSFAYARSNPLPLRHGRICTEHNETINSGRHTIHCGAGYDSHLLVPFIPLK